MIGPLAIMIGDERAAIASSMAAFTFSISGMVSGGKADMS
jgi:hypothetical protein